MTPTRLPLVSLARLAMLAAVPILVGVALGQVCGDADGNGSVTVTDGVQALRAAAALPSSCATTPCDVDASGAITLTDGVVILRAAAALPVTLRCQPTPTPGPMCGDGVVNEATEECDGTDDDACPGRCTGACRCAPTPTQTETPTPTVTETPTPTPTPTSTVFGCRGFGQPCDFVNVCCGPDLACSAGLGQCVMLMASVTPTPAPESTP